MLSCNQCCADEGSKPVTADPNLHGVSLSHKKLSSVAFCPVLTKRKYIELDYSSHDNGIKNTSNK